MLSELPADEDLPAVTFSNFLMDLESAKLQDGFALRRVFGNDHIHPAMPIAFGLVSRRIGPRTLRPHRRGSADSALPPTHERETTDLAARNELNLALTSDFPSTATDAVVARILGSASTPRVAWVPPLTLPGRERFPSAQASFQAFGIPAIELCDIDEEPNEEQIAHLDQYDVVYFAGGDPLVFRTNMERRGVASGVRRCLAAGRLIVAASGGTMQCTQNVSLYRLLSGTVDTVVAEHDIYAGLGLVPYELLPHLNRLDAVLLAKVQRYSEWVPHDIVALEDGGAMIHIDSENFRCVGRGVRFRRGVQSPIEAEA